MDQRAETKHNGGVFLLSLNVAVVIFNLWTCVGIFEKMTGEVNETGLSAVHLHPTTESVPACMLISNMELTARQTLPIACSLFLSQPKGSN